MNNEETLKKAQEAQAEVEHALVDVREFIRLLRYEDFSDFSHSAAIDHLQFALTLLKELKKEGRSE